MPEKNKSFWQLATGNWQLTVERQLRLRGESDVRTARARGKAFADGPLVARVLPNPQQPPRNRYAVVAGKRVGNAVQRNRAKRWVREALRRLHPHLKAGHDIVLIVRGTTDELASFDATLATLERIARRARLFEPSAISHQLSGTPEHENTVGQTGEPVPGVHQAKPAADS